MKRILVSNDDGIHAPGIKALAGALESAGEISVMAPLTEQSATSHSLTLHRPLRIREMGERTYAVEGTPTDCVLVGVRKFLEHQPDLVASGINQGPNMGEDVIYSGTVAAAMEGALLGIPAVAFSLASWEYADFAPAAEIARRLVTRFLEIPLPSRLLVNVNIPPLPADQIRGFKVTRLGTRVYNDAIVQKADPRGRPYYWIGGAAPTWEPGADTDFAAVEEGYVSLTPLLLDITDGRGFEFLNRLELDRS
jgi:5'-nucleotidase